MLVNMLVNIQARIARLNFDEDIRKHQVLSYYINDVIIGDSQSVKVYFGDGTQAANSPIRGYVKVPFRLLRHMLSCHTPKTREYYFQRGTPRPPLQETNKRLYKRMLRAGVID
jgi:hypothetical protein